MLEKLYAIHSSGLAWMTKDVFELGAVICKDVNDELFLGNGVGINVEEG